MCQQALGCDRTRERQLRLCSDSNATTSPYHSDRYAIRCVRTLCRHRQAIQIYPILSSFSSEPPISSQRSALIRVTDLLLTIRQRRVRPISTTGSFCSQDGPRCSHSLSLLVTHTHTLHQNYMLNHEMHAIFASSSSRSKQWLRHALHPPYTSTHPRTGQQKPDILISSH